MLQLLNHTCFFNLLNRIFDAFIRYVRFKGALIFQSLFLFDNQVLITFGKTICFLFLIG